MEENNDRFNTGVKENINRLNTGVKRMSDMEEVNPGQAMVRGTTTALDIGIYLLFMPSEKLRDQLISGHLCMIG